MAGCSRQAADPSRPEGARDFPKAFRPVSTVVSNEFSDEDQRDNLGEAKVVMDLARIGAGTTVADIGAGEGYYTVRLAERVGAKGRVLAQDIDPGAIQRLGQRVERERLDNVSIKLGAAEDPRLPVVSRVRLKTSARDTTPGRIGTALGGTRRLSDLVGSPITM
ncbi:MAG: methyltransferase domain-containing protein [Novosphingobium sp.]